MVMNMSGGFHDVLACLGMADRTHIPIMSPHDFAADYFNRKGWHSIIMQGMVDHLYLFTDVHIGWPGQVYDAKVLSSTRREKMKCFSLSGRVIAGKEVPVLVLGDSVYPLLP